MCSRGVAACRAGLRWAGLLPCVRGLAQGRIALVTGGSGDSGAALAQAGASIAVSYEGERERAEKVTAEVTSLGRRAWTVRLDQVDAAMPEHVIAAIVGHFGRLDVLVNNAAWNIGIPFADLEALTPEIWARMYTTNVRGPFLLARAAARPLREQGAHVSELGRP